MLAMEAFMRHLLDAVKSSKCRLHSRCCAQEFSQKELAAKSVSLNQLNEQNTSAVRESIVMQAPLHHPLHYTALPGPELENLAGAHSRRRAAAQKGRFRFSTGTALALHCF